MAKKKKKNNKIGSWSFTIGLILAVVLGLGYGGDYTRAMTITLVVIGLVVGLLNITGKEAMPFLWSGTVLALMSYLGVSIEVFKTVPIIENILGAILTLFIPATIIVALQVAWSIARK